MPTTDTTNTPKRAAEVAAEWCRNHPGWMRICDMTEAELEAVYETWDELPKKLKDWWGDEDAWDEFGTRECKVSYGFISSEGRRYKSILDIPRGVNFMMVFEAGRQRVTQ